MFLSTREEQANAILSSIPSPIFNQTPIFLDAKHIRSEHAYYKSFLGGVFENISPTLQENEKHPSNM